MICQINSVFPCKDTKAAKSVAFCDSLPVFLRHRAFGAKACHPDQRFCRLCNLGLSKKLSFSLQRDSMPVFYGGILYWLLEKQGKLYFLQSSQTKGRDVLAAFATRFCLRHCVFLCKGTKLQKAALFAIVCRFFCGTELRFGSLCNLGLSKKLRFSLQRHKTADSGLYRILALCNFDLPNKQRFSLQRHKSCKKRSFLR